MGPLKDPLNDRACADVLPPMHAPLTSEELFPSSTEVDWQCLRDHLLREGRVNTEHCLEIVRRTMDTFSLEPNLLKIKDPVTVVGDIHGQFYDFVKLLEVGGCPSKTQYLFLGDYVDRGAYSVEVVLCLFSLKLTFPKSVWMMRGNHESRQMTQFFNFRDECEHKYDSTVFNAIMEAFDCLPLGATVNGKFLALHGGISPELRSTSQINTIERFDEPPRSGMFCDILWADPADEEAVGKRIHDPFIPNEVRGCSYFYSFIGVKTFLDRNGLLSVIRAHEAQLEGYKMHRANDKTGFPTVITIFSAPNYCDAYNNKAAVLQFENNTLNILQFNCTAHPYHLPNFMDVFQWSVPFVAEKVTEMLCYILQPSMDDEDDEEGAAIDELPPAIKTHWRSSLTDTENQSVAIAAQLQERLANADADLGANPVQDKRDRLRRKIRTVAKMQRMFKTLRQQNENHLKLGGMCPGHRMSASALLEKQQGASTESDMFTSAREIDVRNEKMPSQDEVETVPRKSLMKKE